jgi:hypothetical protein
LQATRPKQRAGHFDRQSRFSNHLPQASAIFFTWHWKRLATALGFKQSAETAEYVILFHFASLIYTATVWPWAASYVRGWQELQHVAYTAGGMFAFSVLLQIALSLTFLRNSAEMLLSAAESNPRR